MEKSLIILGGAGQARETAELAELCGWGLVAFVDVSPSVSSIRGVAVMRPEEVPLDGSFALGVGDARLRQRLYRSTGQERSWPNLIHPGSTLSAHSRVADDAVLIQVGVVVSTDVSIGVGCLINYGATLGHDVVMQEFAVVLPGARISGEVSIGSRSTIGAGAVVLPGVRIGSDCRIGAGAVVTRDVGDGMTVVGVPARPHPAGVAHER